ncbi:MAG TPA: mechanosensitive ion channel [Saprospiraceae bacterium]|nr:mechanosensitive ion channel [Saprospiraceae bacterium]
MLYLLFDPNAIWELLLAIAPKILGALITLILGFWLANILSAKSRKLMESKQTDPSLIPFFGSFISIGIKIMVLLSAAGMFGLEVTSFIAIFGAMAFAVGMALQGNLSHFAAGVMILFFRPFRVGDVIVSNGYTGRVNEIQIFNTKLTTLDNRVIIIPNAMVTSAPLENLTKNPIRKVPLTFGIAYGDDIDKARKVIQEVASRCPGILQERDLDIFVSGLGDNSVDFTVRPWCKTDDFWKVHFFMQEEVKKAFDNNGISIPFPQMDVHLHKGS